MIVAKIRENVITKNIETKLTCEELVNLKKEGYMEVESFKNHDYQYRLDGNKNGHLWMWMDDLIIKDTENPPTKNFQLSDLKSGMVVETIFGAMYLIIEIDENKYMFNNNTSISMDGFNNDMTYTIYNTYKGIVNIKRIYKPFSDDSSLKEKFARKLLIWDREESKKELIKEEIERLQKELE